MVFVVLATMRGDSPLRPPFQKGETLPLDPLFKRGDSPLRPPFQNDFQNSFQNHLKDFEYGGLESVKLGV
jgi:hypothetical protein